MAGIEPSLKASPTDKVYYVAVCVCNTRVSSTVLCVHAKVHAMPW